MRVLIVAEKQQVPSERKKIRLCIEVIYMRFEVELCFVSLKIMLCDAVKTKSKQKVGIFRTTTRAANIIINHSLCV